VPRPKPPGVGNEGVVGVSLFMGGDTTPSSAVVQTAGHAYRLERVCCKQEFKRGGLLQRLLLRYTQALMTQMAQTAACNRHHSVEQQLCRWLLLTLDRLPTNELVMTQELVASMLGVRREGPLPWLAGDLQRAGYISYRRGHIAVLDRAGTGGAQLRVLRGGQEGIESPAVRCAYRQGRRHARRQRARSCPTPAG
jgi:CRP-like cAMP-binding protein